MLLLMKRKPGKNQKRLCIVRYGAWGDAVILSPVFKKYNADGWHITLNCTEKCYNILRTNPYIDSFLYQESNEVPIEGLEEHWKKLEKQFDKVINFTGSIENKLLISPSQKEYTLDREELHKRCNKNYYDQTMEIAGYPDAKGERGELHFTKREEKWGQLVKRKYAGFFIVWCLTGSSIHKIYPYAENVIQMLLEGIPECHIIIVGEPGLKGILDPHPRIIDKCGQIDIRKSFILTKYADLVVSTETSVLAASGCFPTPKIALLSHGSEENLTKYYENCHVVRENVPCSPCHKLHYSRETCPLMKELNHPICMGLLSPKKLIPPLEEVYIKWKNKNLNGD